MGGGGGFEDLEGKGMPGSSRMWQWCVSTLVRLLCVQTNERKKSRAKSVEKSNTPAPAPRA